MPAEILANEGVNFRIIRKLRDAGGRVISAAENFPGAKDREVLDHAAKNTRLLLTEDRDYGEPVFAHKLTSTGVLFLTKAIGNSWTCSVVGFHCRDGDKGENPSAPMIPRMSRRRMCGVRGGAPERG